MTRPSTPDEPRGLAVVDGELLRRRFESICEDLGVALGNLARSSTLKLRKDYAIAIADRRCQVVATENPLQLGMLEAALGASYTRFRFDTREGDLVLLSSPYLGGVSVTDFFVVAPICHDHVTAQHVCIRVPVPDMGGENPGGKTPTARELWAEGVPVAPVKLYREGRLVRDVHANVLLNSRTPDQVNDVLAAVHSIVGTAVNRLGDLVSRYGLNTIAAAMEYCQDYTERTALERFGRWSDGAFSGDAFVRDARGKEIAAVRADVQVGAGGIRIDLGRADAQHGSFVNCSSSTARSFATSAVLAALGDDVPANSGLSRRVEVVLEPGTIVNPEHPSPVGGGQAFVGLAVLEAVTQAIGHAAGSRFGGYAHSVPLAVVRQPGRYSPIYDLGMFAASGCSAGEGRDGWGPPHVLSRGVRMTVEEWEMQSGAMIQSMEFESETAGHGQWRGAPGVGLTMSSKTPLVLTLCTAGVVSSIRDGAGACRPEPVTVRSGAGEPVHLDAVENATLLPAGTLRVAFGSGAGLGDPWARPAELVVRDVRDDLISAATARAIYGVVVVGDNDLDLQATRRARGEQQHE